MLNKYFCMSFIAAVILSGIFLLALPNTASAQDIGCCINKQGSCSPKCGAEDSACQTINHGKKCAQQFEEDEFCYQVTNKIGECQPVGCCQVGQGSCIAEIKGICESNGYAYLGDGDCLPQFDIECTPEPTGCCQQAPIGCSITTEDTCNGVSWGEGWQCPTFGECRP